jgi:hypothetical protein
MREEGTNLNLFIFGAQVVLPMLMTKNRMNLNQWWQLMPINVC